MISVNTVSSTGYAYLDGVDVSSGFSTLNSNVLDYTIDNWGIGIVPNLGWNILENGGIADFWLDTNTFIDFSSAAQRSKFRSPTGTPMYLGADGSLPTGASPDIFLTGDIENWHLNKGTGGDFTSAGSAIIYASTNPGSPHVEAPTNGLIGWWKLDELGGTIAVDSSGNGNDATILNPASAGFGYPGQHGRAIDSEVVNMNQALRIVADGVFPTGANPPFTISSWIKLRSTCTALFGNGGWGIGNDEVLVRADNGAYRIQGWGGYQDTGGSSIFDEWILVTLTYDGATLRFYENAVQRTATTQSMTLTYDELTVGSLGGACAGGGRSAFDDVRLYNRGLSQPEIQAIYDAAFCENPAGRIGSIIYNQDNAVMQYCNGRDWAAMGPVGGSGGGGCFSPAGSAGDLMYNNDHEILQFCNGQDWVGMGKQQAPTDGLVGYWTLDEASGTFVDSSGEGNDGGAVGGGIAYRSANGVRGYAAGFDGVDDGIIVAASPELDVGSTTDRVTLSAWVYPRSLTSNARKIISHGDTSTASGYGYRLDASDTYVRFGFYASGGHLFTYNTPLTLDEWALVTATYDGANVKIYLDGVKVSEQAAVFDMDARPAYPVRIGTPNSGADTGRVWDGYLDEVRIYDKALSEQEVKQLYYATK